MCLGDIIYDEGIEESYNVMPANELLDYLKIMEKLKIIEYDRLNGRYNIILARNEFYKICECIPSFRHGSSEEYDNLSGIGFEKYCCNLLRKNGYENVIATQSCGDHGVDIFAEKDGVSYAIQCKCYSGNVGNSSVQQAFSGKEFYKRNVAVVLTNRYFTPQAKQEANALGVALWDRNFLHHLIKKQ